MKKNIQKHFPEVRFVNGKKWLFNPVLKKRFANRPEERVRLQYVEYLLHETTWSKNRIGFEAPVHLAESSHPLRADLVLYQQQMEPFALIECKSNHVKLSQQTAEQAARYNQSINANYLMITNGLSEYWYNLEGQKPVHTASPVKQLNSADYYRNTPQYWIQRGFLSSSAQTGIKQHITNLLIRFWEENQHLSLRYLDFSTDQFSFPIDHFYRIDTLSDGDKMAVTFLFDGVNRTKLIGVLNRDGNNRGIVMIDLETLFQDEQSIAEVHTPSGKKNQRVPDQLIQNIRLPSYKFLKNTGRELLIFFD